MHVGNTLALDLPCLPRKLYVRLMCQYVAFADNQALVRIPHSGINASNNSLLLAVYLALLIKHIVM